MQQRMDIVYEPVIWNFEYQQTNGLFCIHGHAFSKAAEAARTVDSSPFFPTIWRPMGNPSAENPAGIDAAG